jgi:hypothetical protein
MNKEFIPYEEAIALKELGFDELCLAYYQKSSVIGDDTILPLIIRKEATNWNDNSFSKLGVPFYSAPLYSQAFRWFREKHKWSSYIKSIEYIGHNGVKQVWEVNLKYLPTNSEHKGMVYETYEEAELSCLIKLIEIVKDDG